MLGILIEDLPELLVLWYDGPLQGKRGFDWKSWIMIQKSERKADDDVNEAVQTRIKPQYIGGDDGRSWGCAS